MSGACPDKPVLPVIWPAMLEAKPPETRWLIESLWTDEAVGLIGGSPKTFKTWLGLDMAMSVATGTDCLGHFRACRQGSALVYLAEDGLCDLRERLVALCSHRDLPLDGLDMPIVTAPTLHLDRDDDLARLEATLERYTPVLLLLDPFVRLHTTDENSAQDIARILARLRALQRAHHVAILLVHHTRKNQRAAQHGQMLRGSGDFHAWADSALYLTPHKDLMRLTVEHRAAPAPEPRTLRLAPNPPHLELVAAPETPQTLEDRVIAALRQSSTPTTRTTLRGALGVQNQRLGEALERLERLGRIRRTKEGILCPLAEHQGETP